MMIARTKIGDCSSPECNEKDTNCIKVGKELFCIRCRKKQKSTAQLSKQTKSAISRKLYKDQGEIGNNNNAERAFLIQDLDLAISHYVRKRESSLSGIVKCYTCDWSGKWKDADCGHYVPRSNMALRWDLRNLRPQCKMCNQFKYGEVETFGANLNEESPGIVDELLEDARLPCKWSREELKQMLIDIRAKLKIVETKFK